MTTPLVHTETASRAGVAGWIAVAVGWIPGTAVLWLNKADPPLGILLFAAWFGFAAWFSWRHQREYVLGGLLVGVGLATAIYMRADARTVAPTDPDPYGSGSAAVDWACSFGLGSTECLTAEFNYQTRLDSFNSAADTVANDQNLETSGWIAAGLGLILLAASSVGRLVPSVVNRDRQRCSNCAELIRVEAKLCPYCGTVLTTDQFVA